MKSSTTQYLPLLYFKFFPRHCTFNTGFSLLPTVSLNTDEILTADIRSHLFTMKKVSARPIIAARCVRSVPVAAAPQRQQLQAWERQHKRAQMFRPLAHAWDLQDAPWPWLQPGSALNAVPIEEENQQTEALILHLKQINQSSENRSYMHLLPDTCNEC